MMMRVGIWFLRNISVGRIVESAVFNFFICSRERKRERERERERERDEEGCEGDYQLQGWKMVSFL